MKCHFGFKLQLLSEVLKFISCISCTINYYHYHPLKVLSKSSFILSNSSLISFLSSFNSFTVLLFSIIYANFSPVMSVVSLSLSILSPSSFPDHIVTLQSFSSNSLVNSFPPFFNPSSTISISKYLYL